MMRKITFTAMACFLSLFNLAAQLEGVIVETYYISEAKDSLDMFKTKLEVGSVTYRVFLDLEEGFALKALVADSIHPLTISSTEVFFNHPNGSDYPYKFNPAFYPYGTFALDSWLTLGYANDKHMGIPKILDPDSSIIGGDNNSTGMLSGSNAQSGIALTESDGMLVADTTSDFYKIVKSVSDSTFGVKTKYSKFVYAPSQEPFELKLLYFNTKNITGPTPENLVLIAQLTTKGELSFHINCEIIDLNDSVSVGASFKNISYTLFGKDTILPKSTASEKYLYSNWLSYPTLCGCTDPWFVEYNSQAVCDDGSCRDSIVLGCMDITACNFDPSANFNVSEICCYGPNECDNRDINIVCSAYKNEGISLSLYPNITQNNFSFDVNYKGISNNNSILVYNTYGILVRKSKLGDIRDYFTGNMDVSDLQKGMYFVHLCNSNGEKSITSFIKQ